MQEQSKAIAISTDLKDLPVFITAARVAETSGAYGLVPNTSGDMSGGDVVLLQRSTSLGRL